MLSTQVRPGRRPRYVDCSAIRRAVAALLLGGAAAGAGASTAAALPDQCLVLARAPEPISLQGVREQVDQMLAVLSDCQNSPELLAALGHAFNRLGDPVEALGHLERAVMLNPGPPGARLDYAIALAKTGEVPAAVALVDELLQQPDIPPLLLPELQRQRATWVDGGWSGRSVVGFKVGSDSNLLGSPGLTNLTITLPDLAFQLPLDPSFQDLQGNYGIVSFQTEWQRVALDGSYWELSAGLRRRHSPDTALAKTEQMDFAVERAFNLAGGGHVATVDTGKGGPARGVFSGPYVSAGVSSFNTGTNVRYRLLGAAVGWLQQAPGTCQQRLGVEFQQRKYLNSTLLDGRYHGLAGQWVCERPGGQQLQLGMRWGLDRATRPDRPGGDQEQRSLRVAAYLPVRSWWPGGDAEAMARGWTSGALLLEAEHGRLLDQTSFSPLLGNGAVRQSQRTQLRLEYQHPITRQWQLQLGWEGIRQRSNLDLFLLRNRGFYLSIRFGF